KALIGRGVPAKLRHEAVLGGMLSVHVGKVDIPIDNPNGFLLELQEPGPHISIAAEIEAWGSQVPAERRRQIRPGIGLDTELPRPLACRIDPRVLAFDMPRTINELSG